MVVLPLLLIGISSNCLTDCSSVLTRVIYMVLSIATSPEGEVALFLTIAWTTSSAERLNIRSFSGLTLISTVRALEPNGGGAVKPGTCANNGLTRVIAASKISFSGTVLLLNTSSPTGKEEASNRITWGGRAPGGKNADERLTCRATCAEASPISVPS